MNLPRHLQRNNDGIQRHNVSETLQKLGLQGVVQRAYDVASTQKISLGKRWAMDQVDCLAWRVVSAHSGLPMVESLDVETINPDLIRPIRWEWPRRLVCCRYGMKVGR